MIAAIKDFLSFSDLRGGANFKKELSFNYIIRAYLFPILYKISVLILNIRTDIIRTDTETRRKKVLSNEVKSKELNSLKSLNIICNSKILFRKRESRILSPTTKFNNLFFVSLNPITWASPK